MIRVERLRKFESGIVILLLLYSCGVGFPQPWGALWQKVMKLAAYAFIPLFSMLQWKKFISVATKDIPILLLTATALVSVFWSASPGDTLNFGRALLRTTLLGVYLATRYSPEEQMRLMAWVTGISTLLSLGVAFVFPSYGIQDYHGELAWKGAFIQKNSLARMMTVTIILFLLIAIKSRRHRRTALIMSGLSFMLLLLSQGTTAFVLLVLSLSLFPLFNFLKQYYKIRVFLLIIAILTISTLAIVISNNIETIVVDILGKSMTLSGRDELWAAVIEKASERPLLGYGYAGFWKDTEVQYFISNQTWADGGTHAHNGFLDLFADLGWLGIALFVISFLTVYGRTLYLLFSLQAIEYFWFWQFLTVTTLFNYSITGTILDQGHLFWIIYISIAFSTALQKERLSKSSSSLRNKDIKASSKMATS
ncbi:MULTISPECIES: O-antigen ligase family protein [unclassified Coleofasciculus]|uniref:O-antigen ligase family protein n=1 Tax=unclassified Coleofasciculus TaxID=2692782 RepID=UPI00188203CA|nr:MULTISPECIES: O-antigen ligase family protein [unclassified Coleofasciculus]MBE9125337.1 O-antigen ligase family protein [Coleofasciculus sp. LEGE 07081]MBE9148540.1 O-antigen ligase family protein [Coleofasciculus sp. LEGE 07092]